MFNKPLTTKRLFTIKTEVIGPKHDPYIVERYKLITQVDNKITIIELVNDSLREEMRVEVDHEEREEKNLDALRWFQEQAGWSLHKFVERQEARDAVALNFDDGFYGHA